MASLEEIVRQLESLEPASLAELAGFIDYLKWKQGPHFAAAGGMTWQFVPANVQETCLQFATGIRDGSELAEGNVVAFRVFVNGWRIWSDTQDALAWRPVQVMMPTLPGDMARIQLVTDGLGNHQWAWAVWGEPKLLGEVVGQG